MALTDRRGQNAQLRGHRAYQVSRAISEGKLRVVLADFEPEPSPVHLIHPGQGLVPLKMRRFLEFAVPRLRKALTEDQQKLA